MDQAKLGCKCNNNACEQNENNVNSARALTLPMEPHGRYIYICTCSDINTDRFKFASQLFFSLMLSTTMFSRSQTLSPVRNYNTLTTGKEPKYVQIKRTTEQQTAVKPYKVNIECFVKCL